jgi:hypothetical protein
MSCKAVLSEADGIVRVSLPDMTVTLSHRNVITLTERQTQTGEVIDGKETIACFDADVERVPAPFDASSFLCSGSAATSAAAPAAGTNACGA